MAGRTRAGELRSLNPPTLELVGTVPVAAPEAEGLPRKLEAAWRHRRGLFTLARRYLSR